MLPYAQSHRACEHNSHDNINLRHGPLPQCYRHHGTNNKADGHTPQWERDAIGNQNSNYKWHERLEHRHTLQSLLYVLCEVVHGR